MSTQRLEEHGFTQLPVLDLSLLDGDVHSQRAFREQLRSVTHEIGFFYLIGHGIPDAVVERLFAQAHRFFALPTAEKRAIEMVNSPHFRGYTRTGGERTQGKVDWREQIDIGPEYERVTDKDAPAYMRLRGPNLWPVSQPEFREVVTDWNARCARIATRLMRAWAVSLSAPEDIFDAGFAHHPATLTKIVRYPGRKERGQGVGGHKDPGVLTMVMGEPAKAGLQVEYEGEWIDAPPMDGAFVVNIGELLEYATDGYLKATMHRVVTPKEGDVRHSVPFFFNPALDTTVPRIALPEALAAHGTGVTADPDNVITGTFGENALKARLRAHPDVAARHHGDLVG